MMERDKRENPPDEGRESLRRLGRALSHSVAGLRTALGTEAAFRLEVAATAVLGVLAVALPGTPTQTALLLGALLLVLVTELLNSAVEAAVDRISLERHKLSGRAKDMGSAAVLVSLASCAIVWGLVLYDMFG